MRNSIATMQNTEKHQRFVNLMVGLIPFGVLIFVAGKTIFSSISMSDAMPTWFIVVMNLVFVLHVALRIKMGWRPSKSLSPAFILICAVEFAWFLVLVLPR